MFSLHLFCFMWWDKSSLRKMYSMFILLFIKLIAFYIFLSLEWYKNNLFTQRHCSGLEYTKEELNTMTRYVIYIVVLSLITYLSLTIIQVFVETPNWQTALMSVMQIILPRRFALHNKNNQSQNVRVNKKF